MVSITHRCQLPEQEAELFSLPDHLLSTLLALVSTSKGDTLLHDSPQVFYHHTPVCLGRHPL